MQSKSKTENQQTKSLVIGGTGLVGGYIVEHLVRRGERPLVLSRSPQPQAKSDVDWVRGDLERPETLDCPMVETIFCTANAVLLPAALPRFFSPLLKRIVVFSSTSVLTK